MKRTLSVLGTTALSVILLPAPAMAHSTPGGTATAKAPVFVGTGAKRVVLDKQSNIVYLINPNGSLDRKFPVVDSNKLTTAGKFRVTQEMAVNYDAKKSGEAGDLQLDNFTRFNRGIGFHRIPIHKVTKKPIHSEAALGAGTRYSSHGCVRMAAAAAKYLQQFVTRGTAVHVVNSL